MEKTNLTLKESIRIMKQEVKDPYALQYLNSLEEAIDDRGSYGLAVQLSYVMVNLRSWRGTQAREVKDFIKKWIKEKVKNDK